jgi:hypothetical protein
MGPRKATSSTLVECITYWHRRSQLSVDGCQCVLCCHVRHNAVHCMSVRGRWGKHIHYLHLAHQSWMMLHYESDA